MIIITQSTANEMLQSGLNINVFPDVNGNNYVFGLGTEIMVISDDSEQNDSAIEQKGGFLNGLHNDSK